MVRLAQWFIVCALLVLLFQRERVERDKESTRRWYLYKLGLDCVLLATLMVIIVTSGVLHGILQQLHPKQRVDTIHLDFAYIVFQAILTLDLVVSSFWTWFRLKNKSESDKVCCSGFFLVTPISYVHRQIMIGQIIKFISPLLFLQTVYVIIEYALLYHPLIATNNHAVDALLLSRILVFGTTNLIILWFAL